MAKSSMAFQSAAVIGSQDLISQLPSDIIKHILLYLPAKDTARTSTLSQTWLHVWNSLPNASFEFNMPPVIYPFDNPEELQESMKFIDKSLSILREEKVMIQSFKLYMKNADHERYVPLIYDWISLVIKNYVKEIDLMSLNSWHGDSILRVVAIESLVNLKLGGSRIPKGLFCRLNTKLICLRKLYLKLVVMQKDDLQKLISCCPLLEKLKLECLLDPVDFLQCCCPKLKKLVVFSVDRLDIEAPNLEKLDIFGTKEVTVLDCCNVRELKIYFCDNTNKLIQELSPKFPILNKLEVISPGMGEKFEISNHDLQTLLFKNNLAFPFEIKIDAPKLSSFEYFGKQIPFLRYVSSSLNFTKVKLIIGPEGDLDTSWFLRLRDCLHKHKGKIEVNLFMQKTRVCTLDNFIDIYFLFYVYIHMQHKDFIKST
ncbi:putative F-box protein [Quillaja saponaria]|uniref:F-box protein n=1 Tax=Quillaja saponaria TaxID=32244 RepID=A0AAD7PMV2_QUISA|nr:putative F-box protein [Quillaja saponaria]